MAVTREGSRVARRDFEETAGRSPDVTPAPPAERVLALQHSAGNVAVRNMLEARAQLPAAPVLARAPHRPPQGGQINFQGAIWNVVTSTKEKRTITIQQTTGKKQRRDISWEYEDYWIIRKNVGRDYDLRDEEQEDDAEVVRTRFEAAKLRALPRAEPGEFGKSGAVEPQLGHIWLNAVPVGRGAFVH